MTRPAQTSDAKAIAILHQRILTSSFLAKLGVGFLETLYVYFIKKGQVIVHCEGNSITGFISFSNNSANEMKRFLLTCPVCVFKLLGILVSTPEFLNQIMETFAAPFKSKTSLSSVGKIILPYAELLSMSVDPNCQRSGIGCQLLHAMEIHLLQNGIRKYKVIAGVSLESANKFYLRNGFVFISQVMIHGTELSNIYVKEL